MRRIFGLLLALWVAFVSVRADAEQVYWASDALVADMFPTADRLEPLTFTPTPEQVAEAKARLGYPLPKTSYALTAAWHGAELLGWVIFDEQKGQHEPITFAVQVSPAGAVVRHEVVVYRERYGHEVKDPRFRGQFVGKTAASPLMAGKDIRIVSGATYSSRAMAIGVKRALVIVELMRAQT